MHFLAFFSARQPAGRNSQKNTGKLGATPNQRIKKRESGFVVVKTPFILSLTPKTPTHTPPFSLILLEISILLGFAYILGKCQKKIGFTSVNLQIYTRKIDFFHFFAIFPQSRLNIGFDEGKPGFMGVWVLGLGVRVSMEGVLY